MLAAHHAATKARLAAAPILAGKIYDGTRIDTGGNPVQANYIILNTSLPGFSEPRLAADQTPDGDQDLEHTVRVVAVDLAGLYLLMDAVNAQLVGYRLTVAGRELTALDRTEFDPPAYDYTARVHFQDAVFEATTSRA